jgi:hypothetical protein
MHQAPLTDMNVSRFLKQQYVRICQLCEEIYLPRFVLTMATIFCTKVTYPNEVYSFGYTSVCLFIG